MTFSIEAFALGPLLFLLAVCGVPLLGSGVATWWFARGRTGALALAASVVLLLGIVGLATWQMRAMQVQLGTRTLQVQAGVYRHSVPYGQLRLDQAQVLPRGELGARLRWRSNGIGMPGLQAGWFSGSAGRVFAAIGHGEQVLLIPTTADVTLVLGVQAPQRLLQALQAPPVQSP